MRSYSRRLNIVVDMQGMRDMQRRTSALALARLLQFHRQKLSAQRLGLFCSREYTQRWNIARRDLEPDSTCSRVPKMTAA